MNRDNQHTIDEFMHPEVLDQIFDSDNEMEPRAGGSGVKRAAHNVSPDASDAESYEDIPRPVRQRQGQLGFNNVTEDGDDGDNFDEQGANAMATAGIGGKAGTGQMDMVGKGWNRVGHVRPMKSGQSGVREMYFEKDSEATAYSFNEQQDNDDTLHMDPTLAMNSADTVANRQKLYIVPYWLKRGAMCPADLAKLYSKGYCARVKKIGFRFKSIKQKELVIEGSEYNPKLRDKNPNDLQIQYKFDLNGSLRRGRFLVDGFVARDDHQSRRMQHGKRTIKTNQDRGGLGKELPSISGICHTAEGSARYKEYFQDWFDVITNTSDTTRWGVGQELSRMDDELKTTSLEGLVGKDFGVDYNHSNAWLTLHDTINATGATQFADGAAATKYLSVGDIFEHEIHKLETDTRTHFDQDLATNTAWYETLTHLSMNNRMGRTEGLTNGFPQFVMRIRDEDDLQGPLSRWLEMVLTNYVVLEYKPVVIGRDHVFLTSAVAKYAQADYVDAIKYNEELAWNVTFERKHTFNRIPLGLGWKDVQHMVGASPVNIAAVVGTFTKAGEGFDMNALDSRALADGTIKNTGTRLCEDLTTLKSTAFTTLVTTEGNN